MKWLTSWLMLWLRRELKTGKACNKPDKMLLNPLLPPTPPLDSFGIWNLNSGRRDVYNQMNSFPFQTKNAQNLANVFVIKNVLSNLKSHWILILHSGHFNEASYR